MASMYVTRGLISLHILYGIMKRNESDDKEFYQNWDRAMHGSLWLLPPFSTLHWTSTQEHIHWSNSVHLMISCLSWVTKILVLYGPSVIPTACLFARPPCPWTSSRVLTNQGRDSPVPMNTCVSLPCAIMRWVCTRNTFVTWHLNRRGMMAL